MLKITIVRMVMSVRLVSPLLRIKTEIMIKKRMKSGSVPMPKCVPMTRSSELRPLTLLLYVVPVTLMELLRRWGSGATSGSGGGGGGGGGGGTGTHTHIGNVQEEAEVYEGLQHRSRLYFTGRSNLFKIPMMIHSHDSYFYSCDISANLTHKLLFIDTRRDPKNHTYPKYLEGQMCAPTWCFVSEKA